MDIKKGHIEMEREIYEQKKGAYRDGERERDGQK